MTLVIADNVRETSVSTGTGALTLSAVSGFRRFADVCSVNDELDYRITEGTSWEVGVGIYSAANTLTRKYVRWSSNGNAAVSFTSTQKDVVLTYPADRALANPGQNKLCNSSLRFWQRGAPLTLADGGMGPDGWFVLSESGSVVCAQITSSRGGPMAATCTVSSTQRIGMGQILWHSETGFESLPDGGWLQAEVFCTQAATIRAAVLAYTGALAVNAVRRDFVNNWASTTYTAGNFFHADWTPVAVTSQTVSGSSGTVYLSCPVPQIPSGAKNIGIFIWTETQLTNTKLIEVRRPIFTDGDVPQRYVLPDYQQELSTCLRRFCKTFALNQKPIQAINSTAGAIHFPTPVTGRSPVVPWFFPIEMGKEPTVTTYNPVVSNANWRDLNASADRPATIQAAGPKMVRIVLGNCAVSDDTIIHASAEAEPSV